MATFNYKGTDWTAENVVAYDKAEFVERFTGSAYPHITKASYKEQVLGEVYDTAAWQYLSVEWAEAQAEASGVFIAYGEGSEEYKAAKQKAVEVEERLKAIEKSIGISTSPTGNYPKKKRKGRKPQQGDNEEQQAPIDPELKEGGG